jgi:hypothetical protein
LLKSDPRREDEMAKGGAGAKEDQQYEWLRRRGMSKARATRIANSVAMGAGRTTEAPGRDSHLSGARRRDAILNIGQMT